MMCPKCKSGNVTTSVVAEDRKGGYLLALLRFTLVLCTCGLWLLVPRAKTVTKTYAVCQCCGNRWKI